MDYYVTSKDQIRPVTVIDPKNLFVTPKLKSKFTVDDKIKKQTKFYNSMEKKEQYGTKQFFLKEKLNANPEFGQFLLMYPQLERIFDPFTSKEEKRNILSSINDLPVHIHNAIADAEKLNVKRYADNTIDKLDKMTGLQLAQYFNKEFTNDDDRTKNLKELPDSLQADINRKLAEYQQARDLEFDTIQKIRQINEPVEEDEEPVEEDEEPHAVVPEALPALDEPVIAIPYGFQEEHGRKIIGETGKQILKPPVIKHIDFIQHKIKVKQKARRGKILGELPKRIIEIENPQTIISAVDDPPTLKKIEEVGVVLPPTKIEKQKKVSVPPWKPTLKEFVTAQPEFKSLQIKERIPVLSGRAWRIPVEKELSKMLTETNPNMTKQEVKKEVDLAIEQAKRHGMQLYKVVKK